MLRVHLSSWLPCWKKGRLATSLFIFHYKCQPAVSHHININVCSQAKLNFSLPPNMKQLIKTNTKEQFSLVVRIQAVSQCLFMRTNRLTHSKQQPYQPSTTAFLMKCLGIEAPPGKFFSNLDQQRELASNITFHSFFPNGCWHPFHLTLSNFSLKMYKIC